MKKALALVLLFFVAIIAQAQNHFDLGLSLGAGNVISKANHDTALAKQLFDDMESMTDFDLSLAYYFKTQNSLGLEAFFDLGNGRGSVAGPTGQLLNGSLLQIALGLTLNYRWIADKHIMILGGGVARMGMVETLSIPSERIEEEADCIGIPLKFKYEYRFNKSIGLGVSTAAFLGSSNQITETHNGHQTTEEGYTSFARWAITFGPRFYF